MLSEEQNVELRSILEKRDDWTTEEVRKMLKNTGMHYSKHYQHDYLRPGNAEDILEKLGNLDLDHEIIGFLYETSPQTTSSTVGMLSLSKSIRYKKNDNYRANAFCFYSINGENLLATYKCS